MERFQQQRQKPRRVRTHVCGSKSTTPPQGNLNIRRRAEALETLSDSSSCGSYSTEEDLFSYKLRRRSGLKESSEAPMKKLLDEELSKEMEPRRRPPSVIGRLMGLDALPPQQPIKTQQKKFSENYLKKTASIGYVDKRSSHDGRSGRMRKKEQQEFKDVYEVSEPSTCEKNPDLLIMEGMIKSKPNDSKMDFVRQKFLDVKRLSTDEKLQQSKEFHDALEVLDSNKDLLLKFLQEPDSLFAKHLRDLHGVPSPPQSGHITVLQSNANGNLHRKPTRNTEPDDFTSSLQKNEQGAISHSRRRNIYIPSKVSKPGVHEKDASCQLPTRIVVLKPNLKKVQNTAMPVSSPDSSGGFRSGHRKIKEFGSSESLEFYEEVRPRRDSPFELELMKHTTRGSREIAKEITRQMRHSVSSGSKVVSSSNLRGYAGDESSYSLSGNDSPNESEIKAPTSRHFHDLKNRYSPSPSYSTESSVSREAKKRLSERWKMTHRSREMGKGSRGSTLGEMLAMPDKETSLTAVDPIVGPDGFSERLSRNGRVTRCCSPLGISSRDGWKDECLRSLPRSRSLPASSTCLSSPKASIRYESESVNWRSNSSKNVVSEQRDGLFFKSNTKSTCKKSPNISCADGKKNHTVQGFDLKPDEQRCAGGKKHHPPQDADLKPDEPRVSFEGLDLSEWSLSTLDIPVDDFAETTTTVNDREFFTDNLDPEHTPIVPDDRNLIFSHCTITEAESPASSKEAEQPSPVSVLELPFSEESSLGSDSFEKISADLHGLRMQLQLLKSEPSDAYSEGSEMIVSSDEDIRTAPGGLPEDNIGLNGMIRDNVNKDFSYLVGVLVDASFHDADLDVLLETWYSPELPVAPTVFDTLEKKYEEQISWLRSDRRLLFDRINLGLMELLQPHMNPYPWVKLGKPTGFHWKQEHLGEELWNLLVRQDKETEKDSLDMALTKEMKWSDMGDDINAVGNGIERLLFDELVTEVVGSLVIS